MGKRKGVLPDIIRIGFHDYEVEYVEGLEIEDNEIMGVIYENAKKIFVSACHHEQDVPKTSLVQTLMHEILHAIDFMTEFEVFKDKEGAIEVFSEYLCMVIRDNPDFIRLFK